MILLENISKKFDANVALQNIDLAIPKACIFGLLGPNGAGKTTLIRILTQIILPDTGKLYFDGQLATPKHQHLMGYLPEERGLYKKMKVYEQLLYFAQLKGLSKNEAKNNIDFWLQKLEITTWKAKTIEELSKGMQQKVQFVATIAHNPQIIILDEPFTGFDPINAQMLIDIIIELKNNGKTIILSTHRMEQTEQLCDTIAMVHKASLVLHGNLKEIINNHKKYIYTIEYSGSFPENPQLYNIITLTENQATIQCHNTSLNAILQYLLPFIDIYSMIEKKPSLNEIFIEKTN